MTVKEFIEKSKNSLFRYTALQHLKDQLESELVKISDEEARRLFDLEDKAGKLLLGHGCRWCPTPAPEGGFYQEWNGIQLLTGGLLQNSRRGEGANFSNQSAQVAEFERHFEIKDTTWYTVAIPEPPPTYSRVYRPRKGRNARPK